MSNEQNKKPFGISELAGKITKGNKIAGIIIAICMMVLGILFFARPLLTTVAVEYIVCAGFILYGIYQIILYAKTPADVRNGSTIALGILWIVIGILMIANTAVAMIQTFAFMMGFVAMFSGINRISASKAVKEAGGSYSWCIASGIINIVLALFFILTPYIMSALSGELAGIYLLVGGIIFLIDTASRKPTA